MVDGRLVGQANGFVNAEGFLGSLIAPFVFGLFLDSGGGYAAGYLFLAACGLVGLVVVGIFASSRARAAGQ